MSDVLRFTNHAGEVFHALVLGWNDGHTLAHTFWDTMHHTVIKPISVPKHCSVPHNPAPEISWTPITQIGKIEIIPAEQACVRWNCPAISALQDSPNISEALAALDLTPYLKANRANWQDGN